MGALTCIGTSPPASTCSSQRTKVSYVLSSACPSADKLNIPECLKWHWMLLFKRLGCFLCVRVKFVFLRIFQLNPGRAGGKKNWLLVSPCPSLPRFQEQVFLCKGTSLKLLCRAVSGSGAGQDTITCGFPWVSSRRSRFCTQVSRTVLLSVISAPAAHELRLFDSAASPSLTCKHLRPPRDPPAGFGRISWGVT